MAVMDDTALLVEIRVVRQRGGEGRGAAGVLGA